MSRSITIWYSKKSKDVNVEVGNRDLFGTQKSSELFWSLKLLQELKIRELTKLGQFDPIYFSGREQLAVLANEIKLLEKNKDQIELNNEQIHRWIENLEFCLNKLLKTAPKDSIPNLMIG